MTQVPATPVLRPDLNWLLDDFCAHHPPTSGALAVSGDGMLLASSNRLNKDAADTVGASINAIVSLGRGAAKALGAGTLENAVLQLSGGWVLAYAPSDHVVLVVLAPIEGTDLGAVQHGIVRLGHRIGEALDPGTRAPDPAGYPAAAVAAPH
jgi:hypothetical protein